MASIRARLEKIKADPTELIDPDAVARACRETDHRWRDRKLDPLRTLHAFAAQIAHGNTAIAHVVRMAVERGEGFSESAYCQARARLPVAAVRAAFDAFTTRVRDAWGSSDGLWHGHRTALIDGSEINTPDTPELRTTFRVSCNCAEGAGLPSIHTLWLFEAHEGLLLDMHDAPVHTHDQRHAGDLHPALKPGDVLVGDRGLASYIHLHRLAAIGCHGVFRVSTSWKIPFPARMRRSWSGIDTRLSRPRPDRGSIAQSDWTRCCLRQRARNRPAAPWPRSTRGR